MVSFMKYFGITERCTRLFRGDRLATCGLRGGHYIYIIHICKTPGISQEKLSRLVFINKSTVARHLSYLEQKGFVTRIPDKEDRRALLVYPTDRAKETLPVIFATQREWGDYLTSGFTSDEKEQLLSYLSRVTDKAMAYADGRGQAK